MPSTSNRPRPAFQSARVVRVLRWAGCVTALIAAVIVTAVYPSLPAELPAQVDAAGDTTSEGPRWMIWILLAVWLGLQVFLVALSLRPQVHNYPSPVTEANAQALYARGEQLVVAMGVAVAILFAGMVLLVLGVAAIPVVVAGFLILFAVLIAGVARLASIG